MITWKLWHALINPLYNHPIFQHALRKQRAFSFPNQIFGYMGLSVLLICAGFTFFPNIITVLLVFCFIAPFLFMVFNGSVYGIVLALNIGWVIAKEQEQYTHALLCVSPVGPLGAHWLLATGYLHRNNTTRQLHMLVRAQYIVVLGMLGIIGLILLLNMVEARDGNATARIHALVVVAKAALILCGVFFDHVQSLVLGCLVGILAPVRSPTYFEVGFWSTGVYLLLQLTGYLVFIFPGLLLTARLFEALQWHSEFAELLLAALRLLVFYLIREGIIAGMWRVATVYLNSSVGEFPHNLALYLFNKDYSRG